MHENAWSGNQSMKEALVQCWRMLARQIALHLHPWHEVSISFMVNCSEISVGVPSSAIFD